MKYWQVLFRCYICAIAGAFMGAGFVIIFDKPLASLCMVFGGMFVVLIATMPTNDKEPGR